MSDDLKPELLDALHAVGAIGACVFDSAGVVVSVHGPAVAWAPPAGRRIEEAPVFAGLWTAIVEARQAARPLSLPGVSIGIDADPVDIDIHWLDALDRYAALSRSARDRVDVQQTTAQEQRERRLLEEKVREQQAQIAEQAEMMALFVKHVPAAVAMLDADLRVVATSERWKQEKGDPAKIQPGVETASPLTWPGVADRLRLAMEGGVPSSRVEKSTSRGRPVWQRLAQAPWRRVGAEIGGTILFCEDVTEATRKAEDLRARVEDLHKLTAEFDSLGKAVADDLRAPLRQIDFFSRFLLDPDPTHKGKEWARQDYLLQIRVVVERVDRMMGALDRYIRLTERDIVPRRFDIGEAVEIAVSQARGALASAGVHVQLRDTLAVEGDLALVSGLFRRLVDNVVKHAGEGAAIVVACHEEADGVLTTFTDNGVGVPAHLRRRAFNFFERLDAPADVPGEGMGLAECRKIADLHGGAMTLDADFDAGLRALISLPRTARRNPPPPPPLPRA